MWSRVCVSILTIIVSLGSVGPILAAEPEPTKSEAGRLDEIKVSASYPGAVDQALGQSEVPEVDLHAPSISGTLLEPLRAQSGLQVMGSSQFGNENSSLRLRGFDEARFRVLWDGLPVHRDGSYGKGPLDWNLFSPDSVQSVTIYRGSLPAKYGDSLGGVLEIESRPPSEKPELQATAIYGNLNTWSIGANHRWKAGPLGWSLAARQHEADGYLRNNWAENRNFNGNLSLDLPGRIQAGLGLLYSDGKTGLPVYNRPNSPYYDSGKPQADEQELGGPGISSRLLNGIYAWGDNSEIISRNTMMSASLRKKFDNGQARLRGMLWNQETTEKYYASDSGKKIYERQTTPEDNNWQVLGDVAYQLGGHKLEVGGETRTYGWGDQTVPYIDRSYFNQSINYFKFVSEGFKGQTSCLKYSALYAQDTWKTRPDLDLEFGLRGEWFEAGEIDPAAFGFPATAKATSLSQANADPRLAVRFQPWQGGVLGLRLGVAHRYPNSPEYFWWYLNRGSNFFNTDLSPERALQYELGLEQKFGKRLSLAVRGYYYDINDYISSTTVSGVGTVVYNIDSVKMFGGEMEANLALPWGLALWGNLTLQKADKDGDPWDKDNQATNQLPNFPRVMANLGLDYHYSPKTRASLWWHYTDSREYLKDKQSQKLDEFLLLNLQASHRILETRFGAWELLFNVNNLLNQHYELAAGYPNPGLTLMGGLRFVF